MTDDWHTEDFPELRPRPPWVMQEMIEAEPALLEQIATTSDTAPLALLLKVSGSLTVVGCLIGAVPNQFDRAEIRSR